jgi:hypothetical protein
MRRFLITLLLATALTVPAAAQVPPAVLTQVATAVSVANTSIRLKLPPNGPGLFHYIVVLQVTRTCTTTIAGTAVLTISTSNVPGSPAFTMGNACPAGATLNDVTIQPGYPIRSTAANTETEFLCPAIGATGICRITAVYYAAR